MTKQLATKGSAYEGGMAAYAKNVSSGEEDTWLAVDVAFDEWAHNVDVPRVSGTDAFKRWAVWKSAFRSGWREARQRNEVSK